MTAATAKATSGSGKAKAGGPNNAYASLLQNSSQQEKLMAMKKTFEEDWKQQYAVALKNDQWGQLVEAVEQYSHLAGVLG